MKTITYVEDLSSHYFVLEVEENGVTHLQKRRWLIEEGEAHFNRDFPLPSDEYEWFFQRSELVAIAAPTKRWRDREWVPTPDENTATVEEVSRFKQIIDDAVAASRARRQEAQ